MKAVKIVVAAGLHHPALFDSMKIERRKASPSSSPPLSKRTTLETIAGRMASDGIAITTLRAALKDMDQKFGLTAELQEQCQSDTWRPRVHAELVLLDFFWTQNLDFVDGDRYIGCSKAACYCCYHYIRTHPGCFVAPACHNNNWLNWKAPDIYDSENEKLVKTREDILNEMAKRVRQDVFAQLEDRRGPAKWKPDSFTEMSSVCFGKMRDQRLHGEEGIEEIVEERDLENLSDVDVGSSASLDDKTGDFELADGLLENLDHNLRCNGEPERSAKDEMNVCADMDSDDDSSDGGVALTAVDVSLHYLANMINGACRMTAL